ncbi:MAG: DNA repair protein RadA [Clostridia bacterium]|nr:DNA repair protein RadA [Clostridia bacterium]
MAKNKTEYVCSSCGYVSSTWYGRCPSCKEFNTLEEIKIAPVKNERASSLSLKGGQTPQPICEITPDEDERFESGISELDRVLGGGFVKGSVVLVAGEPGIGKSTLLLQACANLCKSGTVLYVSGEESKAQIKMRASRLGINTDKLYLYCENGVAGVLDTCERLSPRIVVIDSIQTAYDPQVQSAAGSITQVKEATMAYMNYAKSTGTTIVIVSHVNKEGSVAGPKTMEHMVDAVLNFEGDSHIAYRVLRAAKNRFGSTNELGMFEMTSKGLREIENPSAALLEGRPKDASGSCVIASLEGTRPILAEVQGLVTKSAFGAPRRTSSGLDYSRAVLILAILEKRVGFKLGIYDAYINVVGGMSIDEPAADLPVALSVASSYLEKPIPPTLAAFGELGLSGEVRAVQGAGQRIAEAKRLGFQKIILPKSCARALEAKEKEGIDLVFVSSLKEAIKASLE